MEIQVKNLDEVLIPISPREIWKHEAWNFSKWLVKDENMKKLSEVLDMDLTEPVTEVHAGRFRTDILTKDNVSDNVVIIENQLEHSNHDHLGKCLTYMAHHQAKYCVWICKEMLPEHRKAIKTLNEKTGSDFRFYGIELKTYKLGEQMVYTFHLVVEPDYDEKYQQSKKDGKNPRQVALNQFWEKVKEELSPVEVQEHFHIQYAGKTYANLTFDDFPFWISTNFSEQKKRARVSIITSENDTFEQVKRIVEDSHFLKLYNQKLSQEDGKRNPNWHFYIDETEFKENPEEIIGWLASSASKMYGVLKQTAHIQEKA